MLDISSKWIWLLSFAGSLGCNKVGQKSKVSAADDQISMSQQESKDVGVFGVWEHPDENIDTENKSYWIFSDLETVSRGVICAPNSDNPTYVAATGRMSIGQHEVSILGAEEAEKGDCKATLEKKEPFKIVVMESNHMIMINSYGSFQYLKKSTVSMSKWGIKMEEPSCSFPYTWSDEFAYGTGTQDDPYLICEPSHLDKVRSYLDRHFVLGKDIDLVPFLSHKQDGKGWDPIGFSTDDRKYPFTGSFDGKNYKVTGFYSYGSLFDESPRGFFGLVDKATIKNLNLEGKGSGECDNQSSDGCMINFSWTSHGGLVGAAYNESTIENCSVTGNIYNQMGVAGGLVGYLDKSTILNSQAKGEKIYFSADGDASGGLVGKAVSSSIEKSSATYDIIIGSKKSAFVGGLVGQAQKVKIVAGKATGSLKIEYAQDTVTDSTTQLELDSFKGAVGGVVGSSEYSVITGSFSKVKPITGLKHVGGLVGLAERTSVANSYAISDVLGIESVGGLIGAIMTAEIEKSYAKGTIISKINSGGLVGLIHDGKINDSYAVVALSQQEGAEGEGFGGIVGACKAEGGKKTSVIRSYAFGSVEGAKNIGGLIGVVGDGCDTDGNFAKNLQKNAEGTESGLLGAVQPDSWTLNAMTGLEAEVWQDSESVCGGDDRVTLKDNEEVCE